MSNPKVVAVVPTFNDWHHTHLALTSLLQSDYASVRIVVVDNGSTDRTPEYVAARFPTVQVLPSDRNQGYAGGCNLGMMWGHAAQADYFFLVNSDVVLAPDTVGILVQVAENGDRVGIVGPKIYEWQRAAIIESVGGQIDWRHGCGVLRGNGERDVGQHDSLLDVDFVSGSALLAKRTVVDEVGLLDSQYFAYYEEMDWCVRARQSGFRIVVVPRARVWHYSAISHSAGRYRANYFTTRNRLLFAAQHASRGSRIYLVAHSLGLLARAAWHWGRGGDRDWARAVSLGIADYWLGRLGSGSYAGRT